MISLLILSMLYGITGMIYIIHTGLNIIKLREIRLFHCMRLMYSFVYGFLPMIVYFKEYKGERNLLYYNYTNDELINLYFFLLLSVMVYGIICFVYEYNYRKRTGNIKKNTGFLETKNNDFKFRYDNYIFLCGTITLIIAVIGLYLWTRAYGSLKNFILNANAIRSDRTGIINKFGYMKYIARLVIIAMFALVSAFLTRKPTGLKRVVYLFLIAVSMIGVYLFLMASDSRITIAYSALGIILLLIRHRKKENIRKYIIFSIIIVGFALFATVYADTFTYYIRYGVWMGKNVDFISKIISEFLFIPYTQQYIIDNCFKGTLKIMIFNDWVNALISWIPESFIPFTKPQTVWAYNTANISLFTSGTIPSDFLSTSIYHLNIIGPFVMPAMYAYFAAIADSKMLRYGNGVFTDPYYGVLVGTFITAISHNELSSFALSLFPLFVFWSIGFFVRLMGIKKKYILR